MNYTSYYVASTYGTGSYDGSTYNGANATPSSSTGAATTGAGSGTLTNTGFDIAASVTLASVIIFGSLLVKFWRRPNVSK